jgi:MerR family transcriptional regulator, thiopeptide resistance regulator
MQTYTISALARRFGLSRSALIYYDKVGLLGPAGRTSAGYRYYTETQARRLQRICDLRDAGLELKQIHLLLSSQDPPGLDIFETRLQGIDREIRTLQTKRQLLLGMLQSIQSGKPPEHLDKQMWVEMLRAAGMDDNALEAWHVEFERRAPESHHQFLTLLNIAESEILQIRQWAGKK